MEQKIDYSTCPVEKLGVFFEKKGYAPVHGRVLAFLLLAEPPYRDFYTIQQKLNVSKSAVSNALKHLTDKGIVQYITFNGDRKRYFQINFDGWISSAIGELKSYEEVIILLGEVLSLRSDSKHLHFNENLERLNEFHKDLYRTLHEFTTKWANVQV